MTAALEHAIVKIAREAGVTVPERIETVEGAIARLSEERQAAFNAVSEANANTLGDKLTIEMLDAAMTGAPMPNYADEAVEAERRAHALEIAAESARRALERAEERYQSAVNAEAGALFRDGARRLASVVAEGRKVAPTLEGIDLENPAQIARFARPEIVKSYRRLAELSDTYGRLRRLYADLKRITNRQDDDAQLDEFRNGREVAGRGAPPRPTDPVARFAWVCTSEAEPWYPTEAELKEAFAELKNRNNQQLAQVGMRRA